MSLSHTVRSFILHNKVVQVGLISSNDYYKAETDKWTSYSFLSNYYYYFLVSFTFVAMKGKEMFSISAIEVHETLDVLLQRLSTNK